MISNKLYDFKGVYQTTLIITKSIVSVLLLLNKEKLNNLSVKC